MTINGPDIPSTSAVGLPPAFDPELAAALRVINEMIAPDGFRPEMLSVIRQGTVAGLEPPSDEALARGGAFAVEERTVPGPPGAPDISLLICHPTAATAQTPALYHIHGGGMVIGDNRTGLPGMLDLAAELGTAVVSVEYRLAPETPHPGPVDDCYAGLVWTAEHAEELGIDPDRIVIAGTSAGGGLAAAVALIARDRGGPALFGQMLMCPMIDDRNDTPSAVQMARLGVWDRTSNETGWSALLGDARGTDDVSPYAAPARATDLSGLPPHSSTWGRRRPSATRMSPTQAASGGQGDTPNCTSGPAVSTDSPAWRRRRPSRRTHRRRRCGGCAGSSRTDEPTGLPESARARAI